MSTVSTLDQAREFLLLAPGAPAADALQAAHDRRAEWQMNLDDPKAPAQRRAGAARKIRTLAPMLPFLECEVQLELAALAAKDPIVGKNQLTRLCDNVAQKIAALPDSEERAMLLCRVEDIRDAAKQSAPPLPPPPAPVEKLPPDPALPVFETKIADLRDAIGRDDSGKLNVARLLAEANKAMSRLRDQPDRDRAETEIDQLERKAEALFLRTTVPPMDFAKICFERLTAANEALDRGDLTSAPALIAKAAEFVSNLTGESLRRATAQHTALTERHRQLLAAAAASAAAEAAAKQAAAGKISALAAALAQSDLPRASTLLAEARKAAAAVKATDARSAFEAEIARLAAQLLQLEREAREQTEKHRQLTAQVAQLRGLLERKEIAPAQKLLGEIRAGAGTLADRAASASLLAELDVLAQRLQELSKPAPPLPPSTGQLLRLTPRDGLIVTGYVPVPLRVVARPRFVIGRFSAEGATRADFLVPLSEKRVSRAHTVLTRQGEEILIQDGDKGTASANGSKLDDEQLTPAPVPASFTRERVISLGGIFSLAAQHLPAEAPGGPPHAASTQNQDNKTSLISLVTGCVKFAAKTEAHLPVQAAWIFTDASFGTAPTCVFTLPHSGLSDTHARVHYSQGAFWLETLHSGNAVRLGDRALAKGEAAALRTGDVLHLGQLAYDVSVEE